MCHLALRLPTVLQIESYEGGVSELTNLWDLTLYITLFFPRDRHSNRIRALVGSSMDLGEPATMFTHNTPFFVVDAVSPDSDLDWLEKIRHSMGLFGSPSSVFVSSLLRFTTFTFSAVARSSVATSQNVTRQPLHLHDEFDASPWTLITCASTQVEYKEVLGRGCRP